MFLFAFVSLYGLFGLPNLWKLAGYIRFFVCVFFFWFSDVFFLLHSPLVTSLDLIFSALCLSRPADY